MDKNFLESLKNGDHFENKEAWNEAIEHARKNPIKPQDVRGAFSGDPPSKFVVNHNRGKLFNYISLSLHQSEPNRCAMYLCDMKYKLVYDNYIWYLFNHEDQTLIVESNVFDYILAKLFELEN